MGSAPIAPISPSTIPNDVFARTIQQLNGHVVDPTRYAASLEGFQKYLSDTGVKSISAEELTRPHRPDIAAKYGYVNFLPPQTWWSRGAALALLTEQIREAAGERVVIRNWWRPSGYNTDPGIGGKGNGDHPTANALDLDYTSDQGRVKAERWLRSLDRSARWMQLSMGLGGATTHIGIGSPKGRREWHYSGWTPAY
jgi:hypothetical protein